MAAKDAVKLQGKNTEVDIQQDRKQNCPNLNDKNNSKPKVVSGVVISDIHQTTATLRMWMSWLWEREPYQEGMLARRN